MNSQIVQAIGWMLITSFTAKSIEAVAKHLSTDFTAPQIVLFYNSCALLFMLPWLMRRRIRKPRKVEWKLFTLRAFLEFSAFTLLFAAIGSGVPLPVVTTLEFSSPLLGTALAVLIFKERSDLHTWLALAIGFIGVLVVIRPGAASFEMTSLLVMAATFFFAGCSMTIKALSRTQRPSHIAFFMLWMTAIIALPFSIFGWDMQTQSLAIVWHTPALHQVPWLLVLGALVYVVQFAVGKAFSKADLTVVLPIFFTGIIWSSGYGYFIFDETLDAMTFIGAAFIIAATMYSTWRAEKRHRTTHIPPEKTLITDSLED